MKKKLKKINVQKYEKTIDAMNEPEAFVLIYDYFTDTSYEIEYFRNKNKKTFRDTLIEFLIDKIDVYEEINIGTLIKVIIFYDNNCFIYQIDLADDSNTYKESIQEFINQLNLELNLWSNLLYKL